MALLSRSPESRSAPGMSTKTANIVAGGITPPAESKGPVRSARMAWIVIGTCCVIGSVLGATTYFRAADGAEHVGQKMVDMRLRGASIDGVACVNETLDWHDKVCDAPGRMCIDAVPKVVGECLAGQDRTALCIELGNDDKPSQWAYNKCKARGVDRKSRKGVKESCTQAWRALDSYCKSGQKGVAL